LQKGYTITAMSEVEASLEENIARILKGDAT